MDTPYVDPRHGLSSDKSMRAATAQRFKPGTPFGSVLARTFPLPATVSLRKKTHLLRMASSSERLASHRALTFAFLGMRQVQAN